MLDKLKTAWNKPLSGFIIRFFLIYIVLILLGLNSNLQGNYANYFRNLGQTFFKSISEKGVVLYSAGPEGEALNLTTKMTLINRDQNDKALKEGTKLRSASVFISSWESGYLPSILVIALIMSTPVTLRRRAIALGWGLLLINLFIIYRIWLVLIHTFNSKEWLEVLDYGPTMTWIEDTCHQLFVSNIVVGITIPVIIWIVVTFRRDDFRLLNNLVNEKFQAFNPKEA